MKRYPSRRLRSFKKLAVSGEVLGGACDFSRDSHANMPKIVGLTGGIASGKSSVSKIWASERITIIDADQIAREVVKPGRPALWLIQRYFGPTILNSDGSLDRAELGRIIFSDVNHRKALNRRTHPFIILTMLRRLFTAIFIRWEEIVVLDTPLLFETRSLLPFCSKVVVVSCDREQQIKRMVQRDTAKGVTEELAMQRLDSQIPMEEKVRNADVVIDNSGEIADLRGKAMHALLGLRPSRAGEFVFRGLLCAVVMKTVLKIVSGSMSSQ